MDFTLTADQELIRSTAREFADREIVPRARENDRRERFDLELVSLIADMGFLGAPVSEEYGGRGLDHVSYALVVEEVGRADSAMRTVVSVQTSLVALTIERFGTDEQRGTILPRLCSGEWLGCFGLTEPDAGSDPASMRTTAVRTSDGWRLSGQKMFISLGCNARVALVFAKTEPDAGHRGITCFAVPMDRPGVSARPIHGKLGLRGSDTAEIFLEDVEVADDEMLGEEGRGFRVAMSALDSGRFSVAAGCVGLSQACVDASVSYARERRQFGRPIASFQLVQQMIADMIVDTEAGRLLVWRAGALKDAGKPSTLETSVAKLHATEASVRAANAAIQVHGGYGYVDEYPVERYMRDARVTTLYEGTSQVQRLIIGREATGISAFV